jgi:butyrate kinase
MAAQYSNRHFFRKTPNEYLANFFEAKGIQLDVNINQLKEQDAEAMQCALNKLATVQITDIEAQFQGINALACEGGILALVDEASFHNDDAFINEIAAIDGFHAKAIWIFLNKPNYWRGDVFACR